MRAEGVVEAIARDGVTVVTRLRSEPPISLRRTGPGVVHQVASGAGPIGGDRLRLRVRVGPGATLVLRTVAASLVLPGPTGLPSRVELDAEVADGGALAVLPEPQVLVEGADHEVLTTVRLGRGAHLTWQDETVLGRHGEPGGSLLHRLRVDRGDDPVVRSDLAVGPRWPDSLGPAGTGGARVVGTHLVVAPDPGADSAPDAGRDRELGGVGRADARPTPPGCDSGVRCAAFALGAGAVLVSALGDDVRAVRAALHLGQPALVHM